MSTPTSVLGEEIRVGDYVAWPIGTRDSILRIGEVLDIEGTGRRQKLRCRMLTDGRGTVEPNRCVHIQPPDYHKAIGKVLTSCSYDDGTPYGKWARDGNFPIVAFDGDSYYTIVDNQQFRIRGNAIQVLRAAQ